MTAKKIIWLISQILLTLCACAASIYVLARFEYFIAFAQIDNIVGMIPVTMAVTAAGAVIALLWMRHTKRFLPLTIILTILAVLSVSLFPNALRGNWWLFPKTSDTAETKSDLTLYDPFTGEKTATLDGESTLKLGAANGNGGGNNGGDGVGSNGESGGLPTMDGATALYPVYAAFAQAVCDETAYAKNNVLCTSTPNAYANLVSGKNDIIFVASASAKQAAAAKSAGADLQFTAIGREAFVFLVGKENPTDSITYQQIRNIYSGKTARWGTLGWREGGQIIAFQRPEGSGSQTGLQTIMGDMPIQVPQPLPDASLIGTNSLMKQISVKWKGVQPALGYSYRFYAETMYPNPDAKFLKVNGVAPTVENIRNGTYPFVYNFYAVTNGAPTGNTKPLLDWILSEQGQSLIEKTGYVPIK